MQGGSGTKDDDDRIVKATSALAILLMALGITVGMLLPISAVEPLLDYSEIDGGASFGCARAHWSNLASTDFWNHEVWVELGSPSRTIKLATRLDLTATAALVSRGVAEADADAILAALAARMPTGRFFTMFVSIDEIVPSLANTVLETSHGLARCAQPVAGIALSICEDALTLTRSPDSTDPKTDTPIAFIVVGQSLLATETTRHGLHGELFLDTGVATAIGTPYGASIGATTLCFFANQTATDVALPRVHGGDTVNIYATRDASGALVGLPSSTAYGRCDYTSAATELFPIRSSSAVETFSTAIAAGVSDIHAFDAVVCGNNATTTQTSTLACIDSGSQCQTEAVLALADISQRALLWNRSVDGSVTLTIERERSTAFEGVSELALALLRLTILLGVAVVAEERSKFGVNGAQLLRTALGWSSVPTTDPIDAKATAERRVSPSALPRRWVRSLPGLGGLVDELADDDDAPTYVHHASAALAMITLRTVQFFLVFQARIANQMHFVVVAEGLSVAISVLVTALRLSTNNRSNAEDLSSYGGSTWLTDGVLVLLSVSVSVPLHENIASHGRALYSLNLGSTA